MSPLGQQHHLIGQPAPPNSAFSFADLVIATDDETPCIFQTQPDRLSSINWGRPLAGERVAARAAAVQRQ